jgi:hypothetical protein
MLVCRQLYFEIALFPFTLSTLTFRHYIGFETWVKESGILLAQQNAMRNIKCRFGAVYLAYNARRKRGGFPTRSFEMFRGLRRIVLTDVPWDVREDEEVKERDCAAVQEDE